MTGKDQSQCPLMQSLTLPNMIHPQTQASLCEVILHARETRQALHFVTEHGDIFQHSQVFFLNNKCIHVQHKCLFPQSVFNILDYITWVAPRHELNMQY